MPTYHCQHETERTHTHQERYENKENKGLDRHIHSSGHIQPEKLSSLNHVSHWIWQVHPEFLTKVHAENLPYHRMLQKLLSW